MAILPTTKHGDPVLTSRTKPVEKVTDEILKLIDDMIETMAPYWAEFDEMARAAEGNGWGLDVEVDAVEEWA